MILRARVPLGSAAAVLALSLAACSQAGQGSPGPETTAPASAQQPSSSSVDPSLKVASPKNLRAVSDPCQLLTAQQLQELGATAQPEPRSQSPYSEPDCSWQNDDVAIDIAPDTKRRGISEPYSRQGNFSNFAKSQVDGYPAARVDRNSRSCGVLVGVADDQEFHLIFTRLGGKRPEYTDPCTFAEKIASMVLKNLPPAS